MAAIRGRDNQFGEGAVHTTLITVTSTVKQAQQTNILYNSAATYTPEKPQDENPGLTMGVKAGVAIPTLVVVAIIILCSWYFCCGGRARRRQRMMGNATSQQNQQLQNRSVVLSNLPVAHLAAQNGPVPGDAPPPQYQEAVPPRHQTIAGGITHVREEEEGVISDGKTPLSEIPFEDVVLSSASSESSSARDFGQRHHGGGGNTYGHTNS